MSAPLDWVFRHGYLGMYGLLAGGVVAFAVPEDTTLIVAGCLVARGRWALLPTWAAVSAGCLTGVTMSYLVGRFLGLVFLKRYGHYIGLTAERVDRAEGWFHRIGKWSLLVSYFIPGIRHFAALSAGTSHLPFPVFVLFAWPGAFIWSTTFLFLGYLLGQKWEQVEKYLRQPQLLVLVAICALTGAFLLWRRRNQSHSPSLT